jgi:hypothetical protein
MNASVTRRGDSNHTPVSGSTGQSHGSPFSGSRRMLLANDDAAAFGFPARTTIVGSRNERPSMKPLRE